MRATSTRTQKLYAEHFHGIRRSHDRVVRLERAGWIIDRRRMFKKPTTVAAEGVALVPDSAAVRVELSQRITLGRFYDVGQKKLLLVHEHNA